MICTHSYGVHTEREIGGGVPSLARAAPHSKCARAPFSEQHRYAARAQLHALQHTDADLTTFAKLTLANFNVLIFQYSKLIAVVYCFSPAPIACKQPGASAQQYIHYVGASCTCGVVNHSPPATMHQCYLYCMNIVLTLNKVI